MLRWLILIHRWWKLALPRLGRDWCSDRGHWARFERCIVSVLGTVRNILHWSLVRPGCSRHRRCMMGWYVSVVMLVRKMRMAWMGCKRYGCCCRMRWRHMGCGGSGMIADCHRSGCCRSGCLRDGNTIRLQHLLIVAVFEKVHNECVLRSVSNFSRIEPSIFPIFSQTSIANLPVGIYGRYRRVWRGHSWCHRHVGRGKCTVRRN